ncbi:MAG TPA: hypothetical protein VM889_03730 [Candidatus Thermoplasmatota archaeon]|nr:hypothetical protein [Candidatus Thermoplasmatota archaeon]
MADDITGAVRILHIVAGVTLAGGAFLWTTVIMPTSAKLLPPPVRGAMVAALFPRVSNYLAAASATAILSGAWLLGLIVGFDGVVPVVTSTLYGAVLAVSLVAMLAALAIAVFAIRPMGFRLIALGKAATPGAPPPPEVPALAKRVARLGLVNFAITISVVALMALAVNLRT